jgi:hypothetical protein
MGRYLFTLAGLCVQGKLFPLRDLQQHISFGNANKSQHYRLPSKELPIQ